MLCCIQNTSSSTTCTAAMTGVTFTYTDRDAYGCTTFDRDTFRNQLGLRHTRPVSIIRVTGDALEVDAMKCLSRGQTYYQLDLSSFGIVPGARVTLRPSARHTQNVVTMTVVYPPAEMWGRRGIVDAIVELQCQLNDLRSTGCFECQTSSEHSEQEEGSDVCQGPSEDSTSSSSGM